MTGFELSIPDLVGGFVGFFLTIFVLSYAFGDNGLFRLAIYIFIGVSTGFVAAAVFIGVLWPQLFRPLVYGTAEERLLVAVPLVLSIILFTKAIPRLSALGAPVMAFLVGIGAATVIGGALLGTLVPQIQATFNSFDKNAIAQQGLGMGGGFIDSVIVLIGLVTTLASFQYNTYLVKKYSLQPLWQFVFRVGRIFIAITLGAIFSGVYLAALTALVERSKSMVDFIFYLIGLAL
jgi:hypothetical protein